MAVVTNDILLFEAKVCYRHSLISTALRCSQCNRYVCLKCAKRTPTGYKCPVCIRAIQDRFYNGRWWDYLIAPLVALPLSGLAAFFFSYFIGAFGFFSLFITLSTVPLFSAFIADSVRWAVGRRRSRYLAHVASSCFIMAIVPFVLLPLLPDHFLGQVGPGINGDPIVTAMLLLGLPMIRHRL